LVKKFILNADDFGMSRAVNQAVLEAYQANFLRSTSLVANGEDFDYAINYIIPQCPNLGIGVHLNIIEGKSLYESDSSLVDINGYFCHSYPKLLFRAYNPKDKFFLGEVEREFRLQIEKTLSKTAVSHIDSHVHVHSIPPIFDLVCRLAKEYGIEQVRTHFEKPFVIPDLKKHLTWKYPLNIFKTMMLSLMTLFNEAIAHKYGLKTNDYLIGILYSSMMDPLVLSYGAAVINYKNIVVEAIIHPSRYEDGTVNNRFDEFLLTKNKKLKEKFENLGYEITNYVKKES